MITIDRRSTVFGVVSVRVDGKSGELKNTNSITVLNGGAEEAVYHIIMQVGYYKYDCWDVTKGEFVTVNLT